MLALSALYAIALTRHALKSPSTTNSSYDTGAYVGMALGLLAAAWGFRRGLKVIRQRGDIGIFSSVSHQRQTAGRKLAVGLACVLVAIVALGAVFGSTSGSAADAWSSERGVNVKAGFIDGCTQSGGVPARCDCIFQHLVQLAKYDTPSEFLTLQDVLARAAQTRSAADLPQALRAISTGCARA